jgi:hypothetical protein
MRFCVFEEVWKGVRLWVLKRGPLKSSKKSLKAIPNGAKIEIPTSKFLSSLSSRAFPTYRAEKNSKSLSAKKLRKIEKVFLIFPHNNYKMLDKTYFHVINSSFFHSPLNCTHISLITKRHFIFVILNL